MTTTDHRSLDIIDHQIEMLDQMIDRQLSLAEALIEADQFESRGSWLEPLDADADDDIEEETEEAARRSEWRRKLRAKLMRARRAQRAPRSTRKSRR